MQQLPSFKSSFPLQMGISRQLSSITSSHRCVPYLPVAPAKETGNKCCCLLCGRGTPPCLYVKSPSWSTIVGVVLYVLHQGNTDNRFFFLKKSIYPFIDMHWEILGLSKKNTGNWKKQVVDALCHDPKVFLSGKEKHSKRGYWGLKNIHDDPWNPNELGCSVRVVLPSINVLFNGGDQL